MTAAWGARGFGPASSWQGAAPATRFATELAGMGWDKMELLSSAGCHFGNVFKRKGSESYERG